MDLKPLRTESDYDAALAEVEQLMDARPGTRKGDQLDVVVSGKLPHAVLHGKDYSSAWPRAENASCTEATSGGGPNEEPVRRQWNGDGDTRQSPLS